MVSKVVATLMGKMVLAWSARWWSIDSVISSIPIDVMGQEKTLVFLIKGYAAQVLALMVQIKPDFSLLRAVMMPRHTLFYQTIAPKILCQSF